MTGSVAIDLVPGSKIGASFEVVVIASDGVLAGSRHPAVRNGQHSCGVSDMEGGIEGQYSLGITVTFEQVT